MNTVHRILGEAVRPPTESERTDPQQAYEYAVDVIGGRWPEGEALIANSTPWAFWYANDVIKGRWPEAEPALMRKGHMAYSYAVDTLKERWPEGEPVIAKSIWSNRYLEIFPDAKDDWLLNGLADWMD